MEKDNLLDIFSALSKIIIIIPIVVVLVALIFKFNKKNSPQLIKFSLPPTITPKIVQKPPQLKIDLKGPLTCIGNINDASISAFIKDKKIKVIVDKNKEKENILISGDCFYNWDEGEFSGKRICGLSSVISLAETMTNFGGLGADLLFSQLNNLGISNQIATDQAKIAKLVNTCKKDVIDEKVFVVPTNILFKNN